jgi:two-component system, NtrC family, response regulator AtoC
VERSPPSSRAPLNRTPLEIAVVVGDDITVFPLPPHGSVTLGRDPGCDVLIDNRSVSRQHAKLHLGPQLRIEDLSSVNGTFLPEGLPTETGRTSRLRRLSGQSADVAVGARINLGSTTVVVRRAATAHRPAASAPEEGTVVRDPAMRALYDQAGRAARSTLSVLLLGETGVGKEVLARTIHDSSPRAAKSYVEINCAAISPALLEGELFGYEKHAFTGANQARPGLLESANGGTVFLDEVGELPLDVQVKLLRVLEDTKVLRIGGRTPRPLDVRFVSATNVDLDAAIARGAFRRDLYFRLNGVSFVVPPLRERAVEIAPLAALFLTDVCRRLDYPEPLRLSREALALLERYAWPGNVRELRNAVERAAALCGHIEILPEDLPAPLQGAASRPADTVAARLAAAAKGGAPDVTDKLSVVPRIVPMTVPMTPERQRILDALEACAGNQTWAAEVLGISLRTLVNRLAKHEIPRPRKRR